MTKNAKLILEIIEEAHCHPTAEEIFFEAKKRSPGIVMATVYNNLNTLCSDGKVRRIKGVGASDRYDNTRIPHDHFICDKCGEISDLFADGIEELLADKTGVQISSYSLVAHGVCRKCRETAKEQDSVH